MIKQGSLATIFSVVVLLSGCEANSRTDIHPSDRSNVKDAVPNPTNDNRDETTPNQTDVDIRTPLGDVDVDNDRDGTRVDVDTPDEKKSRDAR